MAIIYSGGFSHSAGRRAAPPSVRALNFFARYLITFLRLLISSLFGYFRLQRKTISQGRCGGMRVETFFPSADGENIALFNGPARSTDVHLSQNVLSVIESYLHASG
jgi:hypothetical protein